MKPRKLLAAWILIIGLVGIAAFSWRFGDAHLTGVSIGVLVGYVLLGATMLPLQKLPRGTLNWVGGALVFLSASAFALSFRWPSIWMGMAMVVLLLEGFTALALRPAQTQ